VKLAHSTYGWWDQKLRILAVVDAAIAASVCKIRILAAFSTEVVISFFLAQ